MVEPKRKNGDKPTNFKRPRNTEQKFKCQFCPKSYSLVRWNTLHGNRDHLELVKLQWVPCQPCNTFFPTQASLFNHSSHFHKAENYKQKIISRIQCPHCSKSIFNQQLFSKHMNRTHPEVVQEHWIKCSQCPVKFPTALGKKIHYIRMHKRALKGKLIQCQFCPKLLRETALRSHANSFHLDRIEGKWLNCSPCNQFFSTTENLKNHQIQVHLSRKSGLKKTNCEFCPKEFFQLRSYFEHANNKHIPDLALLQWEPCHKCEMRFPLLEDLNRHVELRHSEKSGCVFCQFCKMNFTSVDYLYRHVWMVHAKLAQENWMLSSCCNFYFPTEITRTDHNCPKSKYTDQFAPTLCEFCSHWSPNVRKNVKHCNKEHKSNVASIWKSCTECVYYYPTRKYLKDHIKNCHVLRMKCNLCQISFTNLKVHLNNFHKKCQIYFPNQQSLASHHKTTHFKTCELKMQEAFKANCKFCRMDFKTVSGLLQHTNGYHQNEAAADCWLKCTNCLFYLPTADTLKAHSCLLSSATETSDECTTSTLSSLHNVEADANEFKQLSRSIENCFVKSNNNEQENMNGKYDLQEFSQDSNNKQLSNLTVNKTRASNELCVDELSQSESTAKKCKVCFATFETDKELIIHLYQNHARHKTGPK